MGLYELRFQVREDLNLDLCQQGAPRRCLAMILLEKLQSVQFLLGHSPGMDPPLRRI